MRSAPSQPQGPTRAGSGRLSPLVPWALRAVWAALPLAAGPRLAVALDPRSPAVRSVASVGLWAGWAVVMVATLVPHPRALTTVRTGVAAGAAAVGGAIVSHPRPVAGVIVAILAVVATVGLAFSAPLGMAFVNGPAYPNERRFPLRPPGPLLLGPLMLAWAVAVGAPTATALLMAVERWALGAAVGTLGLPAAAVMARSLHGLSRRWIVFVPAGLVLHDPLSLIDPVLFRRQTIEALRPAPLGSDSLDLSHGAPGLALELVLREKVPMVVVRPGRRGDQPGASARLLFTPTRPGLVLSEARARRLPVG